MAFSLSTEQVKEFSGKVEARHAELMGKIRQLKSDEDQLTATWSGEARAAFDAFMERYYVQADKMNDKLLETSQKIMKMGNEFAAQDADFSARVKAQVSSLDLPAV